MGYITTYSLCLIEGVKEEYDALVAELKDKTGLDFSDDDSHESKRCESDLGLAELTEKHPGITVELYCRGEDSEDVWKSRYRAGERESVGMEMSSFVVLATARERAAFLEDTYRTARENFLRLITMLVREKGGSVDTRILLEDRVTALSWCNRLFIREDETWYAHSLERTDGQGTLTGESPVRLDLHLQDLLTIAQKLINGTYDKTK